MNHYEIVSILILLSVTGLALTLPLLVARDWKTPGQRRKAWRERRRIARWEARRGAEQLVIRAEQQHALWLDGDDRGIYGNYPPADLSEDR